jgi:copper(I)-binding protein
MNKLFALACLAATLAASPAWAQTTVKDAWVRGTVAQQKATGAFMTLTNAQGGKLLSAASPVAGVVEVHEMKMEGNVMKMAAIPSLELPAGKAVELKPGGFHIMLMDLKQGLKHGDSVPLILTIEDRDGKKERLEIKATVRPPGQDALRDSAAKSGH